jgi:type I restriction enzyme S subunit
MSLIHEVSDIFKYKVFPDRWVTVELSKIVKIQNGFAFKSTNFNSDMKGMPLIRIRDIKNSSMKTFYDGEILDDFIVVEEDFIIGMDGDFNSNLWKGKPALLNQRVCRLLPNENIILKKLIYYGLPEYLNKINENTSSTTVKHLSSKSIGEIPFPLPPLAEQRRIVDKLDRLFAQLDTIKISMANIPLLLNNFRQQVLTQAVTGKLTEEWRKGKELERGEDFINRVIKLRKAKASKKMPGLEFKRIDHPFNVDDSWSFGFLQNFGEFTRGKSKHRPRNDVRLFGGEFPFIQTGEVSRSNGLITNYKNTYSEFGLAQSRLFPKGTLCITIAANIAETGILNFDACFPDSVVGYLPFENFYSAKFAMFYFNTIQKDLEHYAPATAQKNINLGILFEVPFPVPPHEEQKQIVRRVESFFATADAIEQQYKSLKAKIDTLPQAILNKAFKGELTEQLDSDGDARELLKQIQELKTSNTKPIKATTKKTKKYAKEDEVLGMVAEPVEFYKK